MKILTIFGTRPEAIKMAPVIKELAVRPEFSSLVCVTAQHREMLDHVLDIFKIKADYDLDIMQSDQTLFDITCLGLTGIKAVLEKEMPDMVLVQGDTTTAFVGSLAAFYLKIPVGHVEAGLRTYRKYQPFPEEINRRLISHLADIHFAPTESAGKNLLSEGIPAGKIFVTGNTVIDALLDVAKSQSSQKQQKKWEGYFKKRGISINGRKIILITGHRRENFGKGLKDICAALKTIAQRNHDAMIIYPVHMNPNVQKPVKELLCGTKNIHLIEPLRYDAFVYILMKASLVLTDSGGIQEEAPTFGLPVLVMRDVTERPEAVTGGTAILVGTDRDKIVYETDRILKSDLSSLRKKVRNPYGDGKAAKRIVNILLKQHGRKWKEETIRGGEQSF